MNDFIIHTYTRADMIADGSLIAVPIETSQEAGITYPVAVSAAAWSDCVEWTDADTEHTGHPQDEVGRLWDVLYMTRFAAANARDARSVTVPLVRLPRHGGKKRTRLVAHVGPGDTMAPVITIMMPDED